MSGVTVDNPDERTVTITVPIDLAEALSTGAWHKGIRDAARAALAALAPKPDWTWLRNKDGSMRIGRGTDLLSWQIDVHRAAELTDAQAEAICDVLNGRNPLADRFEEGWRVDQEAKERWRERAEKAEAERDEWKRACHSWLRNHDELQAEVERLQAENGKAYLAKKFRDERDAIQARYDELAAAAKQTCGYELTLAALRAVLDRHAECVCGPRGSDGPAADCPKHGDPNYTSVTTAELLDRHATNERPSHPEFCRCADCHAVNEGDE